jgi:hypothetical protein
VIYRRLADLVLACHALVVVFFMGWTCPLTPLENRLRKAAGEQGYEGGCVDHYLVPFIARPRDKGSTRQEEIVVGVVFGVVSFVIHAANFAQYRDAIAGLTG